MASKTPTFSIMECKNIIKVPFITFHNVLSMITQVGFSFTSVSDWFDFCQIDSVKFFQVMLPFPVVVKRFKAKL
jgi:hypothetical protein